MMFFVRIDLHDHQRDFRFSADIPVGEKPKVLRDPHDDQRHWPLSWDHALDDRGHLRGCPVCGCRELFVRRDFPQKLGMTLVVLAALAAISLWAMGLTLWGFGVLALMVVIDAALAWMVGRCLVCYRCRSEFRGLPIARDQAGWDLATGEKYRSFEQVADKID